MHGPVLHPAPSVLKADLEIGPQLSAGQPLAQAGGPESLVPSQKHRAAGEGQADQRIGGWKLRDPRGFRCRPNRAHRGPIEHRVEPGSRAGAHGFHAHQVPGHAGKLDLRAKHVGLACVADGVHGLGCSNQVVQQALGFPHDLNGPVRRVDLVEGHRRATPLHPGHLISLSSGRGCPCPLHPGGQAKLPGHRNHLHELDLVHAQGIGEAEAGQLAVHQAKLELGVGRSARRGNALCGRPRSGEGSRHAGGSGFQRGVNGGKRK